MSIQHWMTFATFAEQDHFIYPSKTTYSGIVINGNMAAYAPDGLAAFLLEKNRPTIPYIIDPLTHAFQHDPVHVTSKRDDGTREIKSSIRNLADSLGSVIKEWAGKRPIVPGDFKSASDIEDFVTNALEFQRKHLSLRMHESEVNKYLEHSQEELKPYCLVIPYFFINESTYPLWRDINIQCCKSALNKREEKDVLFASIVVSKGVLSDPGTIDNIIRDYSNLGLDGFLVWVDQLNEHEASSSELSGFVKLASGLRQVAKRKEVINLHGGYFSILLSSEKLTKSCFSGIAHGPEFGETRSVVPVGGGIPIAKFYLLSLHDRIKYGDVLGILNSKGWLKDAPTFYKHVCDCPACRRTIGEDINNFRLYGESDAKLVKRGTGYVTIQFPTRESKRRCLEHYLEMKVREFEFVANGDLADLGKNLDNAIAEFSPVLGLSEVSYLMKWKTVLEASK